MQVMYSSKSIVIFAASLNSPINSSRIDLAPKNNSLSKIDFPLSEEKRWLNSSILPKGEFGEPRHPRPVAFPVPAKPATAAEDATDLREHNSVLKTLGATWEPWKWTPARSFTENRWPDSSILP